MAAMPRHRPSYQDAGQALIMNEVVQHKGGEDGPTSPSQRKRAGLNHSVAEGSAGGARPGTYFPSNETGAQNPASGAPDS